MCMCGVDFDVDGVGENIQCSLLTPGSVLRE